MTRPYQQHPSLVAKRVQRAESWAALYRCGQTLKQIGDAHGVTREYVRQVMTRYCGIRATDGGKSITATEHRREKAAERNARYLKKHGCSFAQYKELLKLRKPIVAYRQQRNNAKYRGIAWEFNVWQWWMLWQESGHWEQRGRGAGYVMCRRGDTGPYSPDNVFIATARENSSKSKHKKSSLPMGVRATRSGKFTAQRMLDGKRICIGHFDTPALAYFAYLTAIHSPSRAAA